MCVVCPRSVYEKCGVCCCCCASPPHPPPPPLPPAPALAPALPPLALSTLALVSRLVLARKKLELLLLLRKRTAYGVHSFGRYIHLDDITKVNMPPKQRPAAAGGGHQPKKSTDKQELGQQERKAGPPPSVMTREMEKSELRSEFERVMEALKCSCPTVIKLVGGGFYDISGEASCCLDVRAVTRKNHADTTAPGLTLSLGDVDRIVKILSKHSDLQAINLGGTCVVIVVFE